MGAQKKKSNKLGGGKIPPKNIITDITIYRIKILLAISVIKYTMITLNYTTPKHLQSIAKI